MEGGKVEVQEAWFASEEWPKGYRGASAGFDIDALEIMTDAINEHWDFDDGPVTSYGSGWPGMESMAYLFRRFGPSKAPWDGYKDICCWVVGTPDPDVKLYVGVGSCGLSCSWLVSDCVYRLLIDEFHPMDGERPTRDRVIAAIKAACRKLTEETSVRDRTFTIYG